MVHFLEGLVFYQTDVAWLLY